MKKSKKDNLKSSEKAISFKGRGNINFVNLNCPACKKDFKYKIDRRNVNSESQCPHCGMAFAIDLKSQSRTWRCEICDKRFKTREEAEKHEKECKSKNKVVDVEDLKNKIASNMTEYREWVDDVINEINEGNSSQEIIVDNLKETRIKTNDLISFFKESKNKLKDKADVKLVQDRIKDLNSELIAINDMIQKYSKVDTSFACPYCKKEINVGGGVQDKEQEITCELCHKKFICITGVVSIMRGNPNRVVQFGAEPISITLKLKNGNTTINFQSHYRFLVTRGDRVTFFYLKKVFSSSYKESPSLLYNWSADNIFKIG